MILNYDVSAFLLLGRWTGVLIRDSLGIDSLLTTCKVWPICVLCFMGDGAIVDGDLLFAF